MSRKILVFACVVPICLVLSCLVVLVFVFGIYRITSGSMLPTLSLGDLVVVNKLARLQRGQAVIVRYPFDPSQEYAKRVIALPGDQIEYAGKRLTINGKRIGQTPMPEFFDAQSNRYYKQFQEQVGSITYNILIDDQWTDKIFKDTKLDRKFCTLTATAISCKVPPRHCFVMGDARDNSMDSRAWGFVPVENVVGSVIFRLK